MKKCSFDPQIYKGQPIGMFHCPECGEMQLAGLPHLPDPNSEEAIAAENAYFESLDNQEADNSRGVRSE